MLAKENIILKYNMKKKTDWYMTLPWRNYTRASCHLSHIITSIHHTFLPQVHHITPAKGQRPSFTLHIEAKLPHSVLVQLNPCAFSINHLVKKNSTQVKHQQNYGRLPSSGHQSDHTESILSDIPDYQMLPILTQVCPVSIQLSNLRPSPYQMYFDYTSLYLQKPLQ